MTLSTADLNFLIDPQLSLIYVQSGDYAAVRSKVEATFGDKVTCSTSARPCYFDTTCDKVPAGALEFKITLRGTHDITIPRESLLVDGAISKAWGSCYVGIYKLPDGFSDTNTYYFGAPLFESHYVSLSLDAWEKDKS